MIDLSGLQVWFAVLLGSVNGHHRDALAYLIEENRILRAQLGGRRLRFTDEDRRRLAVRAFRLGRRALRQATRREEGSAESESRRISARNWLAALDDFRNWLRLGLEARERE